MHNRANPRSSSYRGRGFPRGGFRSYQRGGFRIHTGPDLQPKGELIVAITLASLEDAASAAAEDLPPGEELKISEAKHIASYNWHGEKNSTIIVPGSPARWTPPAIPPALDQDPPNRIYYRDTNSVNFPSYPIEPAVRAVYHPSSALSENFDPSTITIFACSSTLGNLLRFVSSIESSFHFEIEKIGSTLFFVRLEKTPDDRIEGIKGYGHTFPEAYTTWDAEVRESQSHQRILSLEFGGLKILVRAEGDGYLKDKVPSTGGTDASAYSKKQSSSIAHNHEAEEDNFDLVDVLKGLSLPNKWTKPRTPSKTLTVETSSNAPIPQAALFELKTRSDQREFSMDDVLPRLWLNRIPNFILAQHHWGTFSNDKIQVKDVRGETENWEKQHSKQIKAFWGVLKKLIATMDGIREGEKKIGVWRVGGGELQVRKLETGAEGFAALPVELKAKWCGLDAEAKYATADETSGGQGKGKSVESEVESDEDEDDDFLKF